MKLLFDIKTAKLFLNFLSISVVIIKAIKEKKCILFPYCFKLSSYYYYTKDYMYFYLIARYSILVFETLMIGS